MAYREPFPNLTRANHRVVSPAAPDYNCIAWAAECQDRWWWPDPMGTAYWPPGVPREETVTAFEMAYGTLGFAACVDDSLEAGFRKVAIYAKAGTPTHAARQLSDGRWTSKLGEWEDIEHATLQALEGGTYGAVASILRRAGP
jgi:hypothetical protein